METDRVEGDDDCILIPQHIETIDLTAEENDLTEVLSDKSQQQAVTINPSQLVVKTLSENVPNQSSSSDQPTLNCLNDPLNSTCDHDFCKKKC
jgi:hypothetical protein